MRRPQQYILAGNTMIASKRLGDLSITQDDDIGRWPFTFFRTIPVFQVTGPLELRENNIIPLRFVGEDIFKRLVIRGRGGEPSQIHKIPEDIPADMMVLKEPSATSCVSHQILNHYKLLLKEI